MITQEREDYLKTIYKIELEESPVRTTAIAKALGVEPASVTGVIKRLAELDLLEHQPYKGVTLTPSGRKVALSVIRRHRLVELYLTQSLGYSWDEVHDEADLLQDGVNQKIEDRIDEVLGYPSRCPHGEPIPSRDGGIPQLDDLPLVVVSPGTQGRVSRIKTHDPDKLKYLASLNLVPDTPYKLISRQPFNGPIRLAIAGQGDQVIGSELAAAIWVTRT